MKKQPKTRIPDSVFEAENYQSYLKTKLDGDAGSRGMRANLARFLKCQSSYVSQVLTGRSHFSKEQALKIGEFLKLSHDELQFFMLMVDRDRAGTPQLRRYYEQQMTGIIAEREEVKELIAVRSRIPEEANYVYYSSWIYAAAHILSALPSGRDIPTMAKTLNVTEEKTKQVIDWLAQHELVRNDGGKLSIGQGRVHIGSKSPFVARHHAHWRIKALDYFDGQDADDLHYTAILGISKEAAAELKSMLMDFLQRSEKIIADAPEEQATVLLLDLFRL